MSTQQVSISKFFSTPSTDNFLEQQLKGKKGEFVSNVIALTESSPKLQQCDPAKLMKCAMNATALNLPLNKNLGYAYVIPYENKKAETVEPQFQIGYKGFIQLAIRTGQYKTINTCEVRDGEIKRNKFTGEIEFLGENETGNVIGYLAYIKLLNGFEQSVFMTIEKAEQHANKYSQAFKIEEYRKLKDGQIPKNELWKYSSPWYDDFDAMAKKTVLKLLLNRYGVLSVDMQQAIINDQSGHDGSYIDNKKEQRQIVDIEVINQYEPKIDSTEQKEESFKLEQ